MRSLVLLFLLALCRVHASQKWRSDAGEYPIRIKPHSTTTTTSSNGSSKGVSRSSERRTIEADREQERELAQLRFFLQEVPTIQSSGLGVRTDKNSSKRTETARVSQDFDSFSAFAERKRPKESKSGGRSTSNSAHTTNSNLKTLSTQSKYASQVSKDVDEDYYEEFGNGFQQSIPTYDENIDDDYNEEFGSGFKASSSTYNCNGQKSYAYGKIDHNSTTSKYNEKNDEDYYAEFGNGFNPSSSTHRVSNQKSSYGKTDPNPPTFKYDENDDDDYYEEFGSGFRASSKPIQTATSSAHRHVQHGRSENVNDDKTSVQSLQSSISTSASDVFSLEMKSQHSSDSSTNPSLYNSRIAEPQNTLICGELTDILVDYSSGSRGSTPQTPNMLSPLTQSTFSPSSLSSSRSPRHFDGISRTPSSKTSSVDIPRTTSKTSSVDIQRTTSKKSSVDSPRTIIQESSSPMSDVKKRMLRKSESFSSQKILDDYNSTQNSDRYYTGSKNSAGLLISIAEVQDQVKVLRKQEEQWHQNASLISEPVLREFEDGGSSLRPYNGAVERNFTDGCLDWYKKAREPTTVIPSLAESVAVMSTIQQRQFNLSDGAAPWFEPIDQFRLKYRTMVIQAIGPCYLLGGVEVLPAVLRTGQVVGFWKKRDEVPRPRWRPVTWLRLSQKFAFHNNAEELAKEAGFADQSVRTHYYSDTTCDLFLERACLELFAFKDNFPAYVELKDHRQLAHMIGWYVHDSESSKCLGLTMEIDLSVTPLFTSYQTQRSVYAKEHLFPRRILNYTGSQQGQFLTSFPSFFNMPASLNHLLLLPGGSRTWTNNVGNQEMFQMFFGPLIYWLIDPTGYPDVYEPMTLFGEEQSYQPPKNDDRPTIFKFRETLSVGGRSFKESPPLFLPADSFKARYYSPVSSLKIPRKMVPNGFESKPNPSTKSKKTKNSSQAKASEAPAQPKEYQPLVAIAQLTKHNPIVDLFALEDLLHAFNDACMAEQKSACAGAEILFFRIVYRCCCILNMPASAWINAAYAKMAEENLNAVRKHFTKQVDKFVGGFTNGKWPKYSDFSALGVAESFNIYFKLATQDF